jgi:hypothetical protein
MLPISVQVVGPVFRKMSPLVVLRSRSFTAPMPLAGGPAWLYQVVPLPPSVIVNSTPLFEHDVERFPSLIRYTVPELFW